MTDQAMDAAIHLMAADLTRNENDWFLVSPDRPAARAFLNRFQQLYPHMCLGVDPTRPKGKTTITITQDTNGSYFAYAPGRFLSKPCASEYKALVEALGYSSRKGEV